MDRYYNPDKLLEYQQSVKATIYCSLDFKYYPFDKHTCSLNFGSAIIPIGKEKLNHLETKVKSCRSQKVGIKKWRQFFDSMQFAHAQCPLVGFICRKELLQQNGPQGQN